LNPDRTDPLQAHSAGFQAGSSVAGVVRVPGSKSVAQRLLAAAAVARGRTSLEGLPGSADVVGALRCARALGARFPGERRGDDPLAAALLRGGGAGVLEGRPPGAQEGPRPWARLEPGESGTCARLFTALAALARPEGSGAEVVPAGTLMGRTSGPLFEALRRAGAGVEAAGPPDRWPALFTAAIPGASLEVRRPSSSQEVSALLLALAAHAGERQLRVLGPTPSRGYVDMTAGVLELFGGSVGLASLASDAEGEAGEVYTVRGPLTAPSQTLACEGDASAAAVALAAGALSGGRPTSVEGVGLGSLQPDVAITRCLEAFGCTSDGSDRRRLVISGAPTRGAEVDCGPFPDLAPVLAAVAAFCASRDLGASTLTGLGTLPGKESDRIAVLARGLEAVGLSVEQSATHLRIAPGGARVSGPVLLDPAGDHRMVFFAALLSLFEPDVRCLEPGCVRKSWPGFWRDLERAGGTLLPS
jgi:3-phosphoshikimate 1-carboxyvinyltransferase